MEDIEIMQIYLERMKQVQEYVLEYIENENDQEFYLQQLINYFDEQKTLENIKEIKEVLHMLLKISNNNYRSSLFFSKIEQIIKIFKKTIQENFKNEEIFCIFHSNKRILLFLFEEEILKPDRNIASIITSEKYKKRFYPNYFLPQFHSIFDEKKCQEIQCENERLLQNRDEIKNDSKLFEKMQKEGENDGFICQLIRNDSIIEFISYVNQKNLSLLSRIKPSIFETNPFLMKNKNISLIEYSAFFGSIQIFKYLFNNKIQLTSSLWPFVIHGKKPDLIHFLEENQIKPPNQKIFIESIKCHHNDIAHYIENNYFQNEEEKQLIVFSQMLKSFNFVFIEKSLNNQIKAFCEICGNDTFKESNNEYNLFYYLCKYDYINLVDILIKTNGLNINSKTVKRKNSIQEEKTALYIATDKGNTDIVSILLKHPKLDINQISITKKSIQEIGEKQKEEKKSALHIAVEKKFIKIVDLLLKNPSLDVNQKSISNYSYKNYDVDEIIECIIDENEKRSEEKNALHIAVENEYIDIIKALLSRKDLNVNEKLIKKRDRIYMEESAYSYIANVKENEMEEKSSLHIAVLNGNHEIVQLLIDQPNIDVNEKSIRKKIKIKRVESKQSADKNINKKEDKEDEENTALHIAVKNENILVIKLLLKCQKINSNIKDKQGKRPIDLTENQKIKSLF